MKYHIPQFAYFDLRLGVNELKTLNALLETLDNRTDTADVDIVIFAGMTGIRPFEVEDSLRQLSRYEYIKPSVYKNTFKITLDEAERSFNALIGNRVLIFAKEKV